MMKDLSKEAFILSWKCFVSDRGVVSKIYFVNAFGDMSLIEDTFL